MKEFFLEMFSGEAKVSSMRWTFVWTWGMCIGVPISAWAYRYSIDGTADLPVNLVAFIGSVLLIITGGKGWQTKEEKKDAPK